MKIQYFIALVLIIGCNNDPINVSEEPKQKEPRTNNNRVLEQREDEPLKCKLEYRILSVTLIDPSSPDHYVINLLTPDNTCSNGTTTCPFFSVIIDDNNECYTGDNCDKHNPAMYTNYDFHCVLDPYYSSFEVVMQPNTVTEDPCSYGTLRAQITYMIISSPTISTGLCPNPQASYIIETLDNNGTSTDSETYELYGNCGCQIRKI